MRLSVSQSHTTEIQLYATHLKESAFCVLTISHAACS